MMIQAFVRYSLLFILCISIRKVYNQTKCVILIECCLKVGKAEGETFAQHNNLLFEEVSAKTYVYARIHSCSFDDYLFQEESTWTRAFCVPLKSTFFTERMLELMHSSKALN